MPVPCRCVVAQCCLGHRHQSPRVVVRLCTATQPTATQSAAAIAAPAAPSGSAAAPNDPEGVGCLVEPLQLKLRRPQVHR